MIHKYHVGQELQVLHDLVSASAHFDPHLLVLDDMGVERKLMLETLNFPYLIFTDPAGYRISRLFTHLVCEATFGPHAWYECTIARLGPEGVVVQWRDYPGSAPRAFWQIRLKAPEFPAAPAFPEDVYENVDEATDTDEGEGDESQDTGDESQDTEDIDESQDTGDESQDTGDDEDDDDEEEEDEEEEDNVEVDKDDKDEEQDEKEEEEQEKEKEEKASTRKKRDAPTPELIDSSPPASPNDHQREARRARLG
jgi:hypothetical protein